MQDPREAGDCTADNRAAYSKGGFAGLLGAFTLSKGSKLIMPIVPCYVVRLLYVTAI